MSKQTVIITGALTGIGRVLALAFARKGANLVVSGRRVVAGKAFERELRALGADALFVEADVRREEHLRTLVGATLARFGSLDVAVNNAGTEGRPGRLVDQDADTYAATFDTNVLGTLLSMKHELRAMVAQGRGSIVNIASTHGHEGAAFAPIYAASKHAVEGLTRSAALEVAATGVRVNAVAPGPTDTGMLDRFTGNARNKAARAGRGPLGRVGVPDDIAAAVLFIASDRAAFITGQVLAVDGGKTAG